MEALTKGFLGLLFNCDVAVSIVRRTQNRFKSPIIPILRTPQEYPYLGKSLVVCEQELLGVPYRSLPCEQQLASCILWGGKPSRLKSESGLCSLDLLFSIASYKSCICTPQYLEGLGDVASRLITPITHVVCFSKKTGGMMEP